jgi:hypothetical protein
MFQNIKRKNKMTPHMAHKPESQKSALISTIIFGILLVLAIAPIVFLLGN